MCADALKVWIVYDISSLQSWHISYSAEPSGLSGRFSNLKPRHSFQWVILLSTLRLVLSSISGIWLRGQNFQPFLPPSCKFCYIFIFHHKWDIFISPLTNQTVKWTGKSKQLHQQMSGQSPKERSENQLNGMNSRYSRGDVSYLLLPAMSPSKPEHLLLDTLINL